MDHSILRADTAGELMQSPVFRQARRKECLKSLTRLTAGEGQAFLSIYDTLARTRAITPEITTMMDPAVLPEAVFPPVRELARLVGELARKSSQQDRAVHQALHGFLDDWNIAVNAWRNRICLHRSAFLYARYSRLRQTARGPAGN